MDVICPACQNVVTSSAMLCPVCHSSLTGAVPGQPSGPGPADPAAPSGVVCPGPGCGQTNPMGSTTCLWCFTPLRIGPVLSLVFPWGEVPVPERLVIGRDEPPLAAHLKEFSNVSRRHAEVVAGAAATVTDLGSTNGTTRNGEPTAPHTSVPLSDGDILGFGATLKVMVVLR